MKQSSSLSDHHSRIITPKMYPTQDQLKDEVLDMAKRVGSSGFQLLVIDTENKFVSTGFAEEIAKAAQGKYYYLPNASDAAIAAAASTAMAEAKAA